MLTVLFMFDITVGTFERQLLISYLDDEILVSPVVCFMKQEMKDKHVLMFF